MEETGIVAVGLSQPGVAPYRHEPTEKSRQSKPESGGIGRCHWHYCSPARPPATAFRQHRMVSFTGTSRTSKGRNGATLNQYKVSGE